MFWKADMTDTININEFEQLMLDKFDRDRITSLYPSGDVRASKSPLLKAAKNATLTDFIAMVARLCDKSLKKYRVKFIPDEGATIADPAKQLEQPTILYRVIERKPKNELKMRHSEDFTEVIDKTGNKTRKGQVWSQRQSCIVQFDVIASDYAMSDAVMSYFEDMIFTYTGYFKSNGVAEVYFKKYYTDTSIDRYRQYLSVRSIQYFVEIEKQTTIFETTLEDIDV